MAGANFRMLAVLSCTANTSVALTSDEIFASSVSLQADTSNTNYVYVGSSSMTTATGIKLSTGQVLGIGFDQVYGCNGKLDLSKIYVNADTTGNKIRCLYTAWEGL